MSVAVPDSALTSHSLNYFKETFKHMNESRLTSFYTGTKMWEAGTI